MNVCESVCVCRKVRNFRQCYTNTNVNVNKMNPKKCIGYTKRRSNKNFKQTDCGGGKGASKIETSLNNLHLKTKTKTKKKKRMREKKDLTAILEGTRQK